MLKFIAQILTAKGSDVLSISPDAQVYDALVLMAEKNVGSLVVLKEGGVIGMFTERDHARKVDLCGLDSRRATVRQAMSEDIVCVTPQTTVEEALAVVTETRHRHLLVMEDEELVGVASIGDLVKASLDEKDFVIEQLTKYIKGHL